MGVHLKAEGAVIPPVDEGDGIPDADVVDEGPTDLLDRVLHRSEMIPGSRTAVPGRQSDRHPAPIKTSMVSPDMVMVFTVSCMIHSSFSK